jgi:hypothetical protein
MMVFSTFALNKTVLKMFPERPGWERTGAQGDVVAEDRFFTDRTIIVRL